MSESETKESAFDSPVTASSKDAQTKPAQSYKMETEVWQAIIDLIRGASMSDVLDDTHVDLSYPLRINHRNPGGQIASKESIANISRTCRFLWEQVRFHREHFPHAIQWDAKTEEDWARTKSHLFDSGYKTIRGWSMMDSEFSQGKISHIKEILLFSSVLTHLDAGFILKDKVDTPTVLALKETMDIVIDRNQDSFRSLFWTSPRVDVLTKLRETSTAIMLFLNLSYAEQYDGDRIAAAKRERKTWRRLHSLMLFYGTRFFSLLSAIEFLCCDFFPEVQFLELSPGPRERWEVCIALLRNCPFVKTLVFDTRLMNKENLTPLPVLESVTTVALPRKDVAFLGLDFTPNAETIVLLNILILRDRMVERHLRELYDVLRFVAEHKPKATRYVKLRGVRFEKVHARTWPSIVQTEGLETFQKMEDEGISVLDHSGNVIAGTDFKVTDITEDDSLE